MTERTYKHGTRDGIRFAIQWLHEQANQMNDPHAKLVLNAAAFNLGNAAKRSEVLQKPEEATEAGSATRVAGRSE